MCAMQYTWALVVVILCIAQIYSVKSLSSCYICSGQSGKADKTNCHKSSCSAPDNATCQLMVTRMKSDKLLRSYDFRCLEAGMCEQDRQGVVDDCRNFGSDKEKCVICCKTDNCNTPTSAETFYPTASTTTQPTNSTARSTGRPTTVLLFISLAVGCVYIK